MAKSKEKLRARDLRGQGKSIKEIAKLLKVSPGSVSVWCRDIKLTSAQIKILQKRMRDSNYGNRNKYLQDLKEKLDRKIHRLKQDGINKIGKLSKREIFLIGVALYWAEGFKKDHQVGFATSDINMAKFFLYWLNESFEIKSKDLILRVTVNFSYKNKVDSIEKYWSKELNLDQTQFSKPFFQRTVWKKEYENKDEYHGIIRIRVRKSMDFLRKMFGYIEGVAANARIK